MRRRILVNVGGKASLSATFKSLEPQPLTAHIRITAEDQSIDGFMRLASH